MAINPSNTKMKGLLKGLRYISQIFDDNKGREMQIGFPTDVKHVAHIGWDGPSTAASSPSWGPPGHQSGSLDNRESSTTAKEDSGVKWVSEDSGRTGNRGNRSPAHNVPKASRRQSSTALGGNASGSPKREKSEKPKQTRRSSKPRDTSDGNTSGHRHSLDSALVGEQPQNLLPDVPKKTRRKKSKDGTTASIGGSSSRRSKSHTNSDSCASPGQQSATTTV